MAKQVQAELNKSTGDYFIYVDGRKVDGPLSQAEAIREMRKYDNDPAYKTLPPKFTNTASYSNVKKGDRVSVKGAKKYDALSPDTVSGEVLFVHPDGKVAVRVGSGQMNVLPQDIVNSYSNGRQKAETYLNQKMAEAGVRVENITTYVVEGTEYYGGSVFEAVEQWCRTNRKSEARVSSPGSVAGKYEMTVGGRAVKA